ncbi:MAG: type I 3-dehydroquinate dehydratase [Nitrososphaera sp.]
MYNSNLVTAKICVSIATEDVGDMKGQVERAFSLGADFVEIRLDYFAPGQVMAAVGALEEEKGRAVLTLRPKEQGGRFSGTEEERVKLLRKLAEARPMLLDVELSTLQSNDNLADYLELASIPTLASWHEFQKTPPADELAKVVTEMRIYSNYVKVVTAAKSVDDSLRLLELYDGALGLHPIIFAMGEAGVMTRVLAPLYGAPYTYAALEKAVAPGQLTLEQMRVLYSRIKPQR